MDNFKPLHDRVAVKRVAEQRETLGGIYPRGD